ncbi:elongation factor P maturation arginine rhamnosyltransferase EarP [Ideonella sp. 4Y11]|uniref:Protein-arginine rhamnosyltransferase n=1 Tax=Ideonella aquatica TaxID=2824119 RepID=A0A940YP35_9BURK|nr:elongation factor P maturation arginine rhamnosyltransferase EarP [Ideonella aquatica]MBQ0961429.1 elongation factor P maturation arginine rhamnosyltransferase EarP [Ideonella aquatica]
MAAPLWDIFCRVIDNHGDLGVCWRLSVDLAQRGQRVRLWVDEAAALAWMAPLGHAGVEVLHWREDDPPAPGEVVIEAFGCNPPAAFVATMAAAPRPSVWINLEYLSAEPYVERSHGLRSPVMSGPGAGLTKWFFYPGFTSATGGLLREPGRIEALDATARANWLAEQGLQVRPDERLVSLFCYPGAPVDRLLAALADAPTLLLTTPGAASAALQGRALPPGVRSAALPWLPQPAYDQLLAVCDLNLVRGEDSAVRAQWAGRPFLWQLYVQDDGAHETKLAAFLQHLLKDEPPTLAQAVTQAFRAWNGFGQDGLDPLPPLADWQALARRWRARLLTQVDLTTQLLAFVTERR